MGQMNDVGPVHGPDQTLQTWTGLHIALASPQVLKLGTRSSMQGPGLLMGPEVWQQGSSASAPVARFLDLWGASCTGYNMVPAARSGPFGIG